MTPSAVLFSGGLDSAVLLALECRDHAPVHPIHVRAGLAWEDAEAIAIRTLLAAEPHARRVAPLSTLTVDMREIYPPTHWAVVGTPPAFDTPDEDVYLEGRNVILIAKASVLCARLGVGRLALGPLAGNPFPDARPEFFATMAQALSIGLDRPFEIATPLAHLHKEQVVTLGLDLWKRAPSPFGSPCTAASAASAGSGGMRLLRLVLRTGPRTRWRRRGERRGDQ